ncbi:MAG: M1 family aminopeptidase [Flavobacteriales bacterium]
MEWKRGYWVLILWLLCLSMHAQFEYGKDVFNLLEREAMKQQHVHGQSKSAVEIDVHHYACHWKVDPEIKYIEGEVCISFIWKTSGNSFFLDLSDALAVNSVEKDGISLPFTHQNDRLTIFFDDVEEGRSDRVCIRYEGEPETTGFGSFVQYQTLNDGPIIWTLSQPNGAKDWWPCKMTLNDKTDSIDIYIEHPPQYKAASNGLLHSEIQQNGNVITHWKHRYPISTYLIAFAVAGYNVYSDMLHRPNGDSLEVLNYVFPSWEDYARANTPLTVEMIALFEQLFGPYPFYSEKYGHAQFAWGGGMEHQTMSFMGDFDIFLNSHELAHQWFGNAVTCSSWNDIWVNESFATFCTGLAFEFLRSEAEKLNWRKLYIELATSQPDGSVYVYYPNSTAEIFNFRLTYVKGAMVLNMLRWNLGDEVFFQALKNFLSDENLKFNFANTQQLQQHFENAANQSLERFFDQWIFKEGFPEYSIQWFQKDEKLYLQVIQSTSHESVAFFDLPLPFLVKGSNGETKSLRLQHDFSRQVFEVDIDFPINEIVFDPEYLILAKHQIFQMATPSSLDLDYLVYPNPSNGQFQIRPNRDGAFIHSIKIMGTDGRLIQVFDAHQAQSNPIEFTVNSNLSAGVYLLHIEANTGVYQKRLIITETTAP